MTATTQTKPKRTKKADTPEVITAYKGFDKNLQCRGYQYEVGKAYEHKGKVDICESGFHSCTDPFDVLSYYDITEGRFAIVKASGAISRKTDGDTKIASASLHIEAELTLPDFIKRGIKAVADACKSKIADGSLTIGDSATNASSGHSATNASSGDSAKNASSGDSAKNASSGDFGASEALGEHAVIAAAGRGTYAKGAKGVWISLAEYAWDAKLGRNICIGFASGQAGYGDVPADTWLIAKGGKLVPS